jgi:peptide/nickel transport system substrate-binding protein
MVNSIRQGRPAGGRVSRRRVLQAGAVAVAALGAGGLIACSSDDNKGSSGGTSGGAAASPGTRAELIPSGLEKDHPLIAQYHWSKQTISQNPPKPGGRLRVAMLDPDSWDPTDPSATNASNVWGYVYSRLLKPVTSLQAALDGKNNLFQLVSEGDLAGQWEQPDDTTYLFKLRDNITFHNLPPVNGRKVTAEDIVYCFNAYRKPEAAAHVSIFRDVKAIEAPDPTTVKITTNKPVAYLTASLTGPLTVIFARETQERSGGLKAAPPIGTGPFVVSDYRPRSAIVMDKNPNYFLPGRPYLDGVDMPYLPDRATSVAAFRTNQLDHLVVSSQDELKQLQATEGGKMDIHVNQQNSGGVQAHFGMKLDSAPWSDIRFRRGMSMALNRDAQIAAIYQKGQFSLGFPTDWTTRPYKMANADYGQWYKYDLAEAKKLIQAAGVPDGFTITLQSRTNQTFNDMAALAIQDWKKVGITIEYEPLDPTAYNASFFTKKYQGMVLENYVIGGADMDDFSYRVLKSNEPANYFNVNDPQLDNLSEQQQRTFDRPARQKLGDEIVARDLDNLYRLWNATWYFTEVKRPYVQNMVSSDVYWWCIYWGATSSIDAWLDN